MAEGGTLEPLIRLTSTGCVTSVADRRVGIAAGTKVRLTLRERAYLHSLVVNGQWPQARKEEKGLADSAECLRCGGRGTLLHRHCDCECWREVLTLPEEIADLRKRSHLPEVALLLERCLWPTPPGLRKPRASDLVCWRGDRWGSPWRRVLPRRLSVRGRLRRGHIGWLERGRVAARR